MLDTVPVYAEAFDPARPWSLPSAVCDFLSGFVPYPHTDARHREAVPALVREVWGYGMLTGSDGVFGVVSHDHPERAALILGDVRALAARLDLRELAAIVDDIEDWSRPIRATIAETGHFDGEEGDRAYALGGMADRALGDLLFPPAALAAFVDAQPPEGAERLRRLTAWQADPFGRAPKAWFLGKRAGSLAERAAAWVDAADPDLAVLRAAAERLAPLGKAPAPAEEIAAVEAAATALPVPWDAVLAARQAGGEDAREASVLLGDGQAYRRLSRPMILIDTALRASGLLTVTAKEGWGAEIRALAGRAVPRVPPTAAERAATELVLDAIGSRREGESVEAAMKRQAPPPVWRAFRALIGRR